MQPWNTLLIALVSVGLSTPALAQDKKKSAVPAQQQAEKDSDKVDISDLEKKYWAPKDTDFSVVQNRTYSKEGKFFINLQSGPIVNDTYSEGYVSGGSLNYFFSERYGIQANYHVADLKTNKEINNLAVNYGSGVLPDHGRFTSHYGIGFNFVPFYAKMSFLGKKILYFDMAITPHVGMTTYDQMIVDGNRSKSSFTYGIDFTQYFFIAKNIAIRADLKNQWFTEEVVGYANVNKGKKLRDETTQTTLFLLGVTFYFN